MERYALKSLGNSADYIMILRETDDGFIVRIVRDRDGYEDVATEFMSRQLFDSCVRTGYLKKIEYEAKNAVNM